MSSNLALNFRIRADSKQARDELGRFTAQAKNDLTGMQRVAAGALGGITALIGRDLTAALISGGKEILNYSMKMEQMRIGFTTLLGSSQAAGAHLKELETFASRTPFEFEDVARASQRFQNMGLAAGDVIPLLTAVGNAVAAAGGGSEQIDRVTLALAQMTAKGKVSAEEMNQLAEAGIGGWRILETQLGKTKSELMKMAEQGKISSAVFLDAFRKFSDARFGDAMEKQSRTMSGALSTLKDNLKSTTSDALDPYYQVLRNITVTMADLTSKTKTWAQVDKQAASTLLDAIAKIATYQRFTTPKTGLVTGIAGEGYDALRERMNAPLKSYVDEWIATFSNVEKATGPASEALADIERRLRTFGDDSAVTAARETFRSLREDLEKMEKVTPEALAKFDAIERNAMATAKLLDIQKELAEARKKAEEEEKRAEKERQDRMERSIEQFQDATEAFRAFGFEQTRWLETLNPQGFKSNFDLAVDAINEFGAAIDKSGFAVDEKRQGLLQYEAVLMRLRGLLLDVKANMENFEFLPLENMAGGTGDATGNLPVLPDTPDIEAPLRDTMSLIGEFRNFAVESWGAVAQGFGDMVYGWLTGAGAARKSFGEMAKAAIASVTAEAAVRALFEVGMGLASLWLNPKAAADHFLAAKVFGAVAAMGAAVSLAIPGGGGQASSAGGASAFGGRSAGGTGSAAPGTRIVEESRNRVQIIEHRHVFEVQSNDSHIVRVFETDVANNGPMRSLIVQTADA